MASEALVFDLGTHAIKCGSVFNNRRLCTVPLITDESVVNPLIVNGEIADEERMSNLLISLSEQLLDERNFDELKIVATELPYSTRRHTEFISEFFFETLEATHLSINFPAQLSFMTLGVQTGLCLDIGHCCSHVTSFGEGFLIPHAVQRTQLSGSTLIKLMATFAVTGKDSIKPDNANIQVVENPKTMGELSTECLFNPNVFMEFSCDSKASSVLIEAPSLHQLITKSITCTDLSYQGDIWSHIYVTGGGAQIPGIKERLTKELRRLKPPLSRIAIQTIPDPISSAFRGGALICQTGGEEMWLPADEYFEDRNIVNRRFKIFGVD